MIQPIFDKDFLRNKSEPVNDCNFANITKTINEMKYVLDFYSPASEERLIKYCSISAPNIGVLKRIIFLKFQGKKHTLINPIVIKKDGLELQIAENCISLPGEYYKLRRFPGIEISFLDHNFKTQNKTFIGFEAIMLQHELDHLDGKIICDGNEKADLKR